MVGVPLQERYPAGGVTSCAECGKRSVRAPRDELTGLVSRATTMHRLAEALADLGAEPPRSTVAVLFCDIDRFRVINESLGRDAGDMLLQIVARRLETIVGVECGERATVGRVASDEYLVVCPGLADGPHGDAGAAALRLASLIHDAFAEPAQIGEDRMRVRLSIGIAIAPKRPPGIYSHAAADALVRQAESAATRAKTEGRDRIETFDDGMHAHAQQRLRTELELAGACHRGEMRLHYQPVYSLREQRVTGLEGLVRWQHPERGLVAPLEFIPLAEETGLIRQIGEWVMEEAFQQCAEWNKEGADVIVGVNISARQISQAGFVDSVAALLDRFAPYVRTHFEITESVLMADPEGSTAKMHELRALGVRIGLDDFGTGYSSLSYLQQFPVHVVKIDRSFVSGIDSDQRKRAMVQAMVQLSHALGLQALGEGVETPGERRVLEDLGCDSLQGYLLAPPRPARELTPPTFL